VAALRMAFSTPLGAGLRDENMMNTRCIAAGEHFQAIKAFQERHPARFER